LVKLRPFDGDPSIAELVKAGTAIEKSNMFTLTRSPFVLTGCCPGSSLPTGEESSTRHL
jgi:hypothetical protein